MLLPVWASSPPPLPLDGAAPFFAVPSTPESSLVEGSLGVVVAGVVEVVGVVTVGVVVV